MIFLLYLLSFVPTSQAQESFGINERFLIVGVISGKDSVVVIQDKSSGKNIVRKKGESLDLDSEDNKIIAIHKDAVEVKSEYGGVVILEKEQFSTLAANSTPSKPKRPPSDYTNPDMGYQGESPELRNEDNFDMGDSSGPSGARKYSKPMDEEQKETLQKLDDYYLNPDKYSPDEVYEMEKSLFREGKGASGPAAPPPPYYAAP